MPNDIEECLRGLPKKIKIGPYDWSIVVEEGPNVHCGEALFGEQALYLWPENLKSAGLAVGVVLHECLHVVYDDRGLDKLSRKMSRGDTEEEIIMAFEGGLIALFRDNPKLLGWMKKWLKN